MALFWGHDFKFYGVTAFGAFLLYTVLKNRGEPTLLFFSHVLSKHYHDNGAVKILEEAIFIICGAIAGTLLVDPVTELQAFTGGLAWTGLLASKVQTKPAPEPPPPTPAPIPSVSDNLDQRLARLEKAIYDPAPKAQADAVSEGPSPFDLGSERRAKKRSATDVVVLYRGSLTSRLFRVRTPMDMLFASVALSLGILAALLSSETMAPWWFTEAPMGMAYAALMAVAAGMASFTLVKIYWRRLR